jgi:hypothetical protein
MEVTVKTSVATSPWKQATGNRQQDVRLLAIGFYACPISPRGDQPFDQLIDFAQLAISSFEPI